MSRTAPPINADLPADAAPAGSVRQLTAIEWVLGIVLIAVVLLNVVNAAGRYFLSFSFTGADEAMVYLIIAVVMGGTVLSLARRSHINVDLLPSYLSGQRRQYLYIVHDLVALGATVFATYASFGFTTRIARLGTTSMTLEIPMIIPHGMVLIGFAGMALVALFSLVRDVRALREIGRRS
jgi:TRAP-type transport system small permease protein